MNMKQKHCNIVMNVEQNIQYGNIQMNTEKKLQHASVKKCYTGRNRFNKDVIKIDVCVTKIQ